MMRKQQAASTPELGESRNDISNGIRVNNVENKTPGTNNGTKHAKPISKRPDNFPIVVEVVVRSGKEKEAKHMRLKTTQVRSRHRLNTDIEK